jgi:hypothetical protein
LVAVVVEDNTEVVAVVVEVISEEEAVVVEAVTEVKRWKWGTLQRL